MLDHLRIYRSTASETDTSNAITANKGGLVGVASLTVDATAEAGAVTVRLYDDINSSAATAIKVACQAAAGAVSQVHFNPPIGFTKLSITHSGSSTAAYVGYTW